MVGAADLARLVARRFRRATRRRVERYERYAQLGRRDLLGGTKDREQEQQ